MNDTKLFANYKKLCAPIPKSEGKRASGMPARLGGIMRRLPPRQGYGQEDPFTMPYGNLQFVREGRTTIGRHETCASATERAGSLRCLRIHNVIRTTTRCIDSRSGCDHHDIVMCMDPGTTDRSAFNGLDLVSDDAEFNGNIGLGNVGLGDARA